MKFRNRFQLPLLLATALLPAIAGAASLPDVMRDCDSKATLAAIRAGADVNAQQSDGTTPLLLAVYCVDHDAAAELLAIGNEQTRIVAGTGGVMSRAEVKTEREAMEKVFERVSEAMRKGFTTEDMQKGKLLDGLSRKWADPDKAIYDAHKSMWAHYNKLSHTIV